MARKSQVYTKTATFVEDFDKSQEIDFDFVIERVLFRNNETFTMDLQLLVLFNTILSMDTL